MFKKFKGTTKSTRVSFKFYPVQRIEKHGKVTVSQYQADEKQEEEKQEEEKQEEEKQRPQKFRQEEEEEQQQEAQREQNQDLAPGQASIPFCTRKPLPSFDLQQQTWNGATYIQGADGLYRHGKWWDWDPVF